MTPPFRTPLIAIKSATAETVVSIHATLTAEAIIAVMAAATTGAVVTVEAIVAVEAIPVLSPALTRELAVALVCAAFLTFSWSTVVGRAIGAVGAAPVPLAVSPLEASSCSLCGATVVAVALPAVAFAASVSALFGCSLVALAVVTTSSAGPVALDNRIVGATLIKGALPTVIPRALGMVSLVAGAATLALVATLAVSSGGATVLVGTAIACMRLAGRVSRGVGFIAARSVVVPAHRSP